MTIKKKVSVELVILICFLCVFVVTWQGAHGSLRKNPSSKVVMRSYAILARRPDVYNRITRKDIDANRFFKILKEYGPNVIVNPIFWYDWVDWHLVSADGYSDAKQYKIDSKRALNNLMQLRRGDIVYVETVMLDSFCKIADNLKTKIILVTGRRHLPTVKAGICANSILENQWIVHWFTQNPLPISNPKYHAIPYGVRRGHVSALHAELLLGDLPRTEEVMHRGLANTHKSRVPLIQHMDPKASLTKFYHEMHTSIAVISPHGDRWDCYRHAEAILLGCHPLGTMLNPMYTTFYPLGVFINMTSTELLSVARSRHLNGTHLQSITSAERLRFLKPYWYFKIQDLVRQLIQK